MIGLRPHLWLEPAKRYRWCSACDFWSNSREVFGLQLVCLGAPGPQLNPQACN